MSKHTANITYGAGVPVQEGDVVQNVSPFMLLICPSSPANDDNAVETPPGMGLTIDSASQVFVRNLEPFPASYKIIRGL